MQEIIASFVETEGHARVEILIEAIEQRRYGDRQLSFNCYDVIIDAEAQTVRFINTIDRDADDVTIPTDQARADLRA